MRSRILHIAAFLLLVAGVASCFKDSNFSFKSSADSSGSYVAPVREPLSPDQRNVLLYIAGGFNSLSGYLSNDIADLESGTLPGRNSSTDPVLLVLSRLPRDPANPDYTDPMAPVLFRLYAGSDGAPVRDTLKVWSEETPLSQVETMADAFEQVNRAFPGNNRYGIIFSSHASGWLPPRYYENPSAYEAAAKGSPAFSRRAVQEYFPPIDRSAFPAVKSVGMDNGATNYEMDLDQFVAAIPFHLDYLLFDACLMGCVEVAYELRGVADLVGFSQTEVLAEGFDYARLSTHLLTRNPNPMAVCQDYFNYYDAQTGGYRSATISLIDTREMDSLTEVCRSLFEKYRTQISQLAGSRVQGYFRFSRHYFYDLKDILVQAGITPEEEALLQQALDRCIQYKAATPSFISSFSINHYSGLSMYLPSMGTALLDKYYRERIAWNRATGLVK